MIRIIAAVKKEFLQFFRDRMLIFLILWIYTIEVILCAYALSFDVKNLRLVIHNKDGSQITRSLIEKFTKSEYFGKTFYVSRRSDIDDLLDSGSADLALIIPPDFSDNIIEGAHTGVQIILSGSNSNTASIARSYAISILDDFARNSYSKMLLKKGISLNLPEIEPEIRIWYNPELEFRYFMVISMIVVAGVMVGMIHVAAAIVREKERGTLEQLQVTPLKRYEVIIAKLVPTFTIGLLALVPSLLIAFWFHVPLKGSIFTFFVTSAIALFSSMGIGVFISTLSENLQQALLISFFVLFPLMFLSGTIVPVESMPELLQYMSYLSPVTYYMEITLGIFLKGTGIFILWPEIILLLLIGVVLFSLSLYKLSKKY